MRVLVNMGALKKGGGQNVGLNFINGLADLTPDHNTYYFIAAENTEINHMLIKLDRWEYITVSKNPYKRIYQEKTKCNKYAFEKRIDIVYSYFGYGNFSKTITQVSGVADSNLFYPEIDFWKEYNIIRKFYKSFIDNYRRRGLDNSHGLIFENEGMLKKYSKLFKAENISKLIKPSYVLDRKSGESKTFIDSDDNSKTGLFLCGWQLNKNVLLIPEIIYETAKLGIDLKIILTAAIDESPISDQFVKLCKKFNVENKVEITGTINKENLQSLYESCDFIFLLSKLESFSNNIIEAWMYERLLIISDLEWAHSICREAALYVDRDCSKNIAENIYLVSNDSEVNINIIKNGSIELLTYPSIIERTSEEIRFLEEVHTKCLKNS